MISVIIPSLNEEQALPATLRRLLAQEGNFEAILADGGSTDRTVDIAGSFPHIRVVQAQTGRAAQMNAGATVAKGQWLLFLHADTLLPEHAIVDIEGLPERCAAGGFRHRFSGEGWPLRLVSLVDNIRCRSTKIIYGDQAMFVRKALFDALGGFPRGPILEDVRFCESLVKVTDPVLMGSVVTTDSRKFVQKGVWRSLYRCALIIISVELGRPIPEDGLRFFEDVR